MDLNIFMHISRINAQTVTCYLVVTLSCTYGGVDELGAATALHGDADVGWMTAEAAALPRPRQRQHCCHDNQLHPLPGAAQTPATRGDQVSHQILQTMSGDPTSSCGLK